MTSKITIRVKRGTSYAEMIRKIAPLAWPEVRSVDIDDAGSPITNFKLLIGLDEDLQQLCRDFASMSGYQIKHEDSRLTLEPLPEPVFDPEMHEQIKNFAQQLVGRPTSAWIMQQVARERP